MQRLDQIVDRVGFACLERATNAADEIGLQPVFLVEALTFGATVSAASRRRYRPAAMSSSLRQSWAGLGR
jgi:hypothetical protein